MNYENTLKVIKQSNFLPLADLEFISDSLPGLQSNWEKQQRFRTETEMHISVLNDMKHPTRASKYWQAIREQGVFYTELVGASFDYRKNDVEIARKKLLIGDCIRRLCSVKSKETQLSLDLANIELEELEFSKINMQATAKDRMRELRLWQGILEDLDDGSFDSDDVNTHQLVSYAQRFATQNRNMGNASPSEKANLVGQLSTTSRLLHKKGLLDKEGVLLIEKSELYMKTGSTTTKPKLEESK